MERATVKTLCSGHVEIGFVDRCHFYERRKVAEDFVHFAGVFAIALGMAIDKNRLRTEFGGGPQGHGGVHSELARRVGCGRDDSALVALAADDYRLAFQ